LYLLLFLLLVVELAFFFSVSNFPVSKYDKFNMFVSSRNQRQDVFKKEYCQRNPNE
jgi:hypothetical protein